MDRRLLLRLLLVAVVLLVGCPKGSPPVDLVQAHRWETKPPIVVCESLLMHTDEIDRALADLQSCHDNTVLISPCPYEAGTIDGAIVVDAMPQDMLMGTIGMLSGVTIVKSATDRPGVIRSAFVGIAQRDWRVLRHELGHAFGWGHTWRPGHAMHYSRALMGDDLSGMSCDDAVRPRE